MINLAEMSDSAVTPKLLTEGEEALVEITKVDNHLEDDKPWLKVVLSDVNVEANTYDIHEFIDLGLRIPPFVNENDAGEVAKFKNRVNNRLKSFFETFGIDGDDRNVPEAWEGKQGTIIAKVVASKDDYPDKNQVKRYAGPASGM